MAEVIDIAAVPTNLPHAGDLDRTHGFEFALVIVRTLNRCASLEETLINVELYWESGLLTRPQSDALIQYFVGPR